MTAITPNQWTILESLTAGPRWMRSFQTVRPLLADLQGRGLIEPCRPHLGRARNMVRLTDAGCDALEISPDSVPATREQPKLVQAPKLVPGAIRDGIPEFVRQRCDAFVRGLAAGELPKALVGQLAAAYGVQRPAIWKNLREGGVIPPYQPRQANGRGRPIGGGERGYTERRRRTHQEIVDAREADLPPVVSRDPCPRCEVRGDIGCRHTKAPVATAVFE